MKAEPLCADSTVSDSDTCGTISNIEAVNSHANILDELDGMITIIDAETFQIVYANKAALAAAANISHYVGCICYEGIHKSFHRCEDCLLYTEDGPASDTKDVNYAGRTYHMIKKRITWDNRPALFEYSVDITDHVKSEQSEREMALARKKEQALLAAIPGGIAIYHVKKSGVVTTEYVSEGLAQLCDYHAEEFLELLRVDACKNIVEEDLPRVEEAIDKSIAAGSPLSLTYRIYKKDHTPILIRLEAQTLDEEVIPDDDLAVYYAVHTAVSEEAKKIIDERGFFRDLINTVPLGIGIYNVSPDHVSLEYINDAYYDMLGVAREDRKEFIGRNTLEAIHPEDVGRAVEVFNCLIAGDSRGQAEVRVRNAQGGWVWINANVVVADRREDSLEVHASFLDITQSREQQESILEFQHAAELVQEQGSISIFTYDVESGYIRQRISLDKDGSLGYPVEIHNAPQCFIDNNQIYPDDIETYLQIYQRIKDGASSAEGEYRLLNVNTGQFRWTRMILRTMKSNFIQGRLVAGCGIDVDAKHVAIARYQEEERLRRQLFRNAVAFVEFNLTTKRCEKLDFKAQVVPEEDWGEIGVDSYREAVCSTVEEKYRKEMEKYYADNLLAAFRRGERTISSEYRSVATEKGPGRWYRNTAMLTQRPDSDDIVAFVYVEDINVEMIDKIAFERSAIEGVGGILVIDVGNGDAHLVRGGRHFESAQKKLEGLGDFSYNDHFAKASFAAVVEDEQHIDWTVARLENVVKELADKEMFQYSVSTVNSSGKKRRHRIRYRYLDDRKQHIVMTDDDITAVYEEDQARKRELERALRQAQESSRDKAAFYSRMSHDMRTPMNGILGMAELSRDEDDIAVLKENMAKVESSGQYLLSLINDTLDVQRIESGKMVLEPKIVNTREVLANIIDMIRPTADAAGVTLRLDQGNTDIDWYIRIDPVRIEQVLLNLLSNAIKFTPSGGLVDLRFELLEREGLISHDVIYVRDTGIGMSADFIQNGIFKPFSQENNEFSSKYAGSGLGLSIAKSLVELMGGHMEVTSELGTGTTFAVYLDFERVDPEEVEKIRSSVTKSADSFEAHLEEKRILLVEDNELNAEIAVKLLERVGCVVTRAKDGQEAVSFFGASPLNGYDAVLMDIRMPVMDGLAAARFIRALNRPDAATTPIIAMTANTYQEDIDGSLEAGMNEHLAKPVNPQMLYETLCRFV